MSVQVAQQAVMTMMINFSTIIIINFDILYFLETRLRMLLEGGQIQLDILNKISMVLLLFFLK